MTLCEVHSDDAQTHKTFEKKDQKQSWVIFRRACMAKLLFLFKLLSWVIVLVNTISLASSTSIPNNATTVLQDILNPKFYDKRLRPDFEGKPVDVAITVFLTSIGGLDEQEMQFKTTFFLRQSWQDKRLSYKNEFPMTKNMSAIRGDIMSQLWIPDVYINNEKSSFAPENQFLIRISNTGNVMYSQRMTVEASCMMDLTNYPMDKQRCTLNFESYSMTTDDLDLHWETTPFIDSVAVANDISLSQFALDKYTAERTVANYTSGSFSFLKLNFYIRRKKFYYVIQTYIPTILITILSWVSFWIPRSSPPARVALGITTVLALTTLIFGIQSSMPKVSYVKAIDWFLMVSFTYVFAALIEYPSSTFIKFQAQKLGKGGKTFIRRVKGEPMNVTSTELPMSNYAADNAGKEMSESDEEKAKRADEQKDVECAKDEKGFSRGAPFNHNSPEAAPQYSNGELRKRKTHDEKHQRKSSNNDITDVAKSNVVDEWAKLIFPVTYFLYNVGYWIVYLFEINLISKENT